MINNQEKYNSNKNKNIMEINTNKIIQQAKELALIEIPEECQETAKNFFDCIHENLKPFDKDGKFYSSKEMEDILENEIIPKCKNIYNIEKCLENHNINKIDEKIEEEEDEEEEDEIKL